MTVSREQQAYVMQGLIGALLEREGGVIEISREQMDKHQGSQYDIEICSDLTPQVAIVRLVPQTKN